MNGIRINSVCTWNIGYLMFERMIINTFKKYLSSCHIYQHQYNAHSNSNDWKTRHMARNTALFTFHSQEKESQLTLEMQSLRFGAGPLGLAFPNKRFIIYFRLICCKWKILIQSSHAVISLPYDSDSTLKMEGKTKLSRDNLEGGERKNYEIGELRTLWKLKGLNYKHNALHIYSGWIKNRACQ